jgi:uncharacterized membrane protein YbhN (UPF0104 family)
MQHVQPLSSPRSFRAAPEDQPEAAGKKRFSVWKPLIALFAITLAAVLLYRTFSNYSFEEIKASVAAVPATRLAMAGAFAAASYLCLTGFDYLAIRYVGKSLSYPKVALTSFTSLSLGHTIGLAALSSGAVRYRFYTRWGLSGGDVARIIIFCGITVGLGLIVLGGLALLIRSELAAGITGLGQGAVIAIGCTLLGLAALYVGLCALVRRPLTIRKWSLELPSVRLALGQIVIGPLNFACVAGCLHQALASVAEVAYLETAAAYVIANAMTMVSHVPGGLGVIESVVLFLLPGKNLIGPLLVFRFVYFLVPFALGAMSLGLCELLLRRRARSSG